MLKIEDKTRQKGNKQKGRNEEVSLEKKKRKRRKC